VAAKTGQVTLHLPFLSGRDRTKWEVYSASLLPASWHTLQKGFLLALDL